MYRVTRVFLDKYTKRRYEVGESFTSDDPDRIEDLLNRGLIEGVPEDGTPSPIEAEEYNSYQLMTKKELMDLLNRRRIDFNKRQTKAELSELLRGGD